eukprot:m.121732 g.121732  ORF g.121732 m.121732 type:complete len:183 (+) comp52103_c0_seq2:85-633(+)
MALRTEQPRDHAPAQYRIIPKRYPNILNHLDLSKTLCEIGCIGITCSSFWVLDKTYMEPEDREEWRLCTHRVRELGPCDCRDCSDICRVIFFPFGMLSCLLCSVSFVPELLYKLVRRECRCHEYREPASFTFCVRCGLAPTAQLQQQPCVLRQPRPQDRGRAAGGLAPQVTLAAKAETGTVT